MKNKWSIFIAFILLHGFVCLHAAQGFAPLVFKTPAVLKRLPNKEVQSVYQGREGDLWICTRNGLFHYNGYALTCYKSDYARPFLLTNNNVLCVAEDTRHRLWIGTLSGLNVLDLQTLTVRKINHEEMNRNTISSILVTRNGRILFATDWGLYEYDEATDDFHPFTPENTRGILPKTSIKSLLEDHRGDVWIGTWNEGLFRHERITGHFHRYPRLNAQNSAHVLLQDSRHRIWVGSWLGGLTLLEEAYQPDKVRPVRYLHNPGQPASISDDIIYALAEDPHTGNIWVGTRRGLSILPAAERYTGQEAFVNHYPDLKAPNHSISSDEVNSLLCDRQGLMWIGMIGGGIDKVDVRKADFGFDVLTAVHQRLHTSSVRSLCVDRDGQLWLGIGSYGFGIYNREDGQFMHYSQMPEFAHHPTATTTVTSILQDASNHHFWITAYDDGVYEIDMQAPVGQRVRHHLAAHTSWLPGDCVYQVIEDSRRNLWFATRNGVSMRRTDGTTLRLDTLSVDSIGMKQMPTISLTEDKHGNIWCGSVSQGVFRLHPDRPDSVQTYTSLNGKFKAREVNYIYCDALGHIWVATNSSGLHLYDEAEDTFLPVHERWKLPGDVVSGISSDREGNLWLSTDVGLLKLMMSDDPTTPPAYLLYTVDDGLQDNSFNRAAVTTDTDGRIYFGGNRGYNSFLPGEVGGSDFAPSPYITDIRVLNHSWHMLPAEERAAISPLAPRFARHIRLDYRHNNFGIEFSAMDHTNPELNTFAYKLEGFDTDWQYTTASMRLASYNNLASGTYTFCLKAAGTNGMWSTDVRRIRVEVLPPPWRTWWAYAIYLLLIAGGTAYVWRSLRNRIRLQNALRMREMEKAKVEEMNHVKLQFFTNITHELLTPLTILSASVDELKRLAPSFKEQYALMHVNIDRLIRLIQQILEFRKAESGNLQLRVSQSDLALFVRRSIDSFRPLMRRKDIEFSCVCNPEPLNVYFDTDKLDKILYNLLSNASKYNRPGGHVWVELEGQPDGNARITVRDDGPGFSKDAQKGLFKRFYEGDYRKHHTIGTGIGLSLVRDLVRLHHGNIEVESEEGKGTTFFITLPVVREAYMANEIDDASPVVEQTALTDLANVILPDAPAKPESEKPYSLLVVEDNHELLLLMSSLLRADFKVHTAHDGKEAMEILEAHTIDLIVSDVMMDGMNGLDLCRQVKARPESKDIPIILLTAKKDEDDRIAAYEAGADAFISKPFNLGVLQARIGNLINLRKRMAGDADKQLVFNVKDYNYTDADQEFLQACIDCVNRHIADTDFTQMQLADEMHMSKSTLFRRIKQLTGNGVSVFIGYIRIKTATRIIEERKSISITELSYMVGYNDPRYFSASFKKVVGITPTEYMRNLKEGTPAAMPELNDLSL